MNLDDLKIFSLVVSCGSFTAAATKLAQPKGTVSRRVAVLEKQLGAPLMIRTTRKIQLTDLGQNLYAKSFALLQELEEVEQEVLSIHSHPAGLIKIQHPVDFFSPYFIQLLNDFMELYPDIQVSCSHYLSSLPDFFNNDDIGFCWYESALPSSDWIAQPLMSIQQGIYGTRKFKGDYKLTELSQLPCVLGINEQRWLFRSKYGQQSIEVSGNIMLDGLDMKLEAAIKGQGISKLPCYLCSDALSKNQIVKLKSESEPIALNVALLYRSRNLPQKVRLFIDFFQSNIGQV